MKSVKKIYVNKKDSCAEVVHKIIHSKLSEFVLYIPKSSAVAENIKNFKLLKREADSACKKIIIESVDEDILKMASSAGFETVDGIFNHFSSPETSFMDIVPAKKKTDFLQKNKFNLFKTRQANNFLIKKQKEDLKERLAEEKKYLDEGGNLSCAEKENLSDLEIPVDGFRFKKIILAVICAICAGIAGYILFFILPSAEISIEREKTEWSFSDTVVASVNTAAVLEENSLIPAQIFNFSKNIIQSFPATGKEKIERRATGTITIWNAHSSERQPLVKNTRFRSPDGRIYRLTHSVVIPGAAIRDGRIHPSSIEATVIADIAGEAHNTGPIQRLSIPGFQGTSKHNSFYGEFKNNISGGFIGEVRTPTDEDIRKARESVKAKIKEAIKYSTQTTIPKEFKIIESAIGYKITKEGVASEKVNEKGEFSYGMAIEANVPAYKEEHLILLMKEKFKESENNYDLIDKKLSYGDDFKIDFSKGTIFIPVQFKGVWARSFDAEKFKKQILGMDERSLREKVFSIPGVVGAEIKLWPFWVNDVPKNASNVMVTID